MDKIELEQEVAILRERVAIGVAIKELADRLHEHTSERAEYNIEGINMVMDILLDRQRKAGAMLDANLALLEGKNGPTNT